MAKKKSTPKKKSARRKPASAKRPSGKKPTGKKKYTSGRKKTAAKKSSRSSAKRTSATTRKKRKAKARPLGRPLIPVDAKLDIVFQRDYRAREVFAFLEITTIRELEKFGPDEIIKQLTSPIIQTVGRIRKAMALCNRTLSDDTKFAMDFRARVKADS